MVLFETQRGWGCISPLEGRKEWTSHALTSRFIRFLLLLLLSGILVHREVMYHRVAAHV